MFIYYVSLGYDAVAHTVYTSRDTWMRTYGTTAPLEEGDILASTPIHGSTPAKFPEITKQPPALIPLPPRTKHPGWSTYSGSPMTATGSFDGSNKSKTTTSRSSTSQPHHANLLIACHVCLSEPDW